MKIREIKDMSKVIADCLTRVEAAAGAGEWERADIQAGIVAYFSDNPSEVIKKHLHLSNIVEIFAGKEYGWTFAEFGDATEWLYSMRKQIASEISAIIHGRCTSEAYGYHNQETFLKNNRRLIAKLDEVLGN